MTSSTVDEKIIREITTFDEKEFLLNKSKVDFSLDDDAYDKRWNNTYEYRNSDKEFVLTVPEKYTVDKTDQYGQSEFMQSALLELDDDFRNIIILREIQGTSYEIISKILKLPLGTVKSRLNRGKLKLRDILIKLGVKN